jgi:hypothetical protein
MNHKLIYLAAASALMLAACSDDAESNYPEDNVIRVSAPVTNTLQTRAAEDFTQDDFALYICPESEAEDFTYENVKYVLTDNVWSAEDGVERHWQSASTRYNYYAYAPASGTNAKALTGDLCAYDLSSSNIDLLWTSGSGTPSKFLSSDKTLSLLFNHMFCQFSVEVEIGNAAYNDDFTKCPFQNVWFTNEYGKGDFNVKTGELLNTSYCTITADATPASYTAGSRTSDGKYLTKPCYMAPGKQAVTVYIVTGDYAGYSYKHTEYNFEAGKSYTLKVKLGESSLNGVGLQLGVWDEVADNDELTTF